MTGIERVGLIASPLVFIWIGSLDIRVNEKEVLYLIWEPIEGFENYEISDTGSIRNAKTGARIMPQIRPNGKRRVTLSNGKIRKTFMVDRLVVDTFLLGYHDDCDIIYRDGNPANLDVRNLILQKRELYRIYCHEYDEVYDSIGECSRELNIPKNKISDCVNGRRRSYRGLHFSKWYDVDRTF